MNTFQTIRTYFAVLGIQPQRVRKYPHNVATLMILLLMCASVILACIFLFKEKTIVKCAKAFDGELTTFVASFELAIYIWKSEKLFKFMNKFELIIQQSKLNSFLNSTKCQNEICFFFIFAGIKNSSLEIIYVKSNEQTEKWCKLIYFALAKVTAQCAIWPTFVMSYFTYYSTKWQNEAFEMPVLMW